MTTQELGQRLAKAANTVPQPVTPVCHPSTWRGRQEAQKFEASLSHMVSSGLPNIKGYGGVGRAQPGEPNKHEELRLIPRTYV